MTMETSLLGLLVLTSLLCCTTHQAHLTMDPMRSQYFEGDSVSLSCEGKNNSAGWTVKRETTKRKSNCDDGWGTVEGSVCYIMYVMDMDSGVYWCESREGASSSSIQLTVTDGSVILQSPVLPVMEGDDVTLSCETRTAPSNLPAAFFKDGVFIGNETSGSLTLHHVTSSDEGLYRCRISDHGESPSSRISVSDKPPVTPSASMTEVSSKAPPPASNPLRFLFLVFRRLLVFSPYFISTLLLGSLCRRRCSASSITVSEGEPHSAQELEDKAEGVTKEHHL
ncbi:high affinity immunoglobulin epsilon receptor subunit alpha-like [Fundulus diaphanus]